MTKAYIAKIYIDKEVIAEESGNDLDELYNWMLIKAQGKFGNVHGNITQVKTGKVVKSFKKSPPD